MGVLQTSKKQALMMSDSTNVKAKGKKNGKGPKASYLNPKESKNYSKGDLGSTIKKTFEKTKCPYCMRGFHPEN